MKNKRLLIVFLAVCCLLSGCMLHSEDFSKAEEETLTVLVSTEMDQYTPVSALMDLNNRMEMEEKLGIKIAVRRVEIEDPNDLDVFDLFLFDQPTWIVQLADNTRIRPVSDQIHAADDSFGKYKGSQYGFVFPYSCASRIPQLLVLPDSLEEAGIREIPFTPEAFSDALLKLSEDYQAPIAVSGEPTCESYFLLLSLFGIAPSGGNEFYIEDGNVSYDKLSSRMEEYLTWLRSLYMDHLLPEDMLLLSEYSMINMLNKVSVMAVFSSDLYLNEAIRTLRENGKRAALAEIPLPLESYETGVNRRMIGVIGYQSENAEKCGRLLELLAEIDKRETAEDPLKDMEIYPLFSQDTQPDHPEKINLFGGNEMVLTYWYQMIEADRSYLAPVFDRAATDRNTAINTLFDEARNQWLENKVFTQESIPNNRNILKIYTNRYNSISNGWDK